ncbi:MAG TPA: DUF309 domain-containing protein [Streptosporangiaceae bacterium]|nr:DUF309 domain-containing protein [Streptosporangiaceae bacterium]
MNRDRDISGRPRNARPRDALGRPLPRDATGEPGTPDDLELPAATALAEAQRLIDADRPFHAHEVLEASWKVAAPAERDLWQGLAQIAVGLTHAHRGNSSGAVALLRRGADGIRPYGASAASAYGVDVARAVMETERLAERIERHGLDGLPPSDLHPRLLA